MATPVPLLLLLLLFLSPAVLVLCGATHPHSAPRPRWRGTLLTQHQDTLPPYLGGHPSLGVAPEYQELWFTQSLDHFSFSDPRTFAQRYLVCDKFWDHKTPTMFFYTGNEGDIVNFYGNTGFVFDIAPRFNALVVFAEHRYYGKTMPLGKDSLTTENMRFLTSEQALADFAELIQALKTEYKMDTPDASVIAFGGSYGGMLSSWFRIKYPSIVDGAIAASAPILQFQGLVDPSKYFQIITNDYARASAECPTLIKQAFSRMVDLSASSSGLATISQAFQTCAPLKTANDGYSMVNWMNQGFQYMAMTDYPYPSNFLMPMPGWPVQVSCQRIHDSLNTQRPGDAPSDLQLLQAVAAGVGVYYNFTGTLSCVNSTQPISPSLGDAQWNYQACSEMIMPISQGGPGDMFLPFYPWNLEEYVSECKKSFPGIQPRPFWIPLYYGGKKLEAAGNIVFSNGDLDPWMGGGVTENISDSVVAVMIKDGAHHLDLRFYNKEDPKSVLDARELEVENIERWIRKQ